MTAGEWPVKFVCAYYGTVNFAATGSITCLRPWDEVRCIVEKTGWSISDLADSGGPGFVVVLKKNDGARQWDVSCPSLPMRVRASRKSASRLLNGYTCEYGANSREAVSAEFWLPKESPFLRRLSCREEF